MWIRIRFICSKCGIESWTEFNNDIWVMKVSDLICDDCNPMEEDE